VTSRYPSLRVNSSLTRSKVILQRFILATRLEDPRAQRLPCTNLWVMPFRISLQRTRYISPSLSSLVTIDIVDRTVASPARDVCGFDQSSGRRVSFVEAPHNSEFLSTGTHQTMPAPTRNNRLIGTTKRRRNIHVFSNTVGVPASSSLIES